MNSDAKVELRDNPEGMQAWLVLLSLINAFVSMVQDEWSLMYITDVSNGDYNSQAMEKHHISHPEICHALLLNDKTIPNELR